MAAQPGAMNRWKGVTSRFHPAAGSVLQSGNRKRGALKQKAEGTVRRGARSAPKQQKGAAKRHPQVNLCIDPPPLEISQETRSVIESLLRRGKQGQLTKLVNTFGEAWLKSWKTQLGIKRGRPRKRAMDTTGLLCAAKVEGWLAVFHPAMETKRELQKRFRNLSLVREQLIKMGYSASIADVLISCRTPFQAACTWAGIWAESRRSPETIANYSRRYRKLVWRYVPREEDIPPGTKPVKRVRLVIDLAPYFSTPTGNWPKFP
jgi:hypothetical protein